MGAAKTWNGGAFPVRLGKAAAVLCPAAPSGFFSLNTIPKMYQAKCSLQVLRENLNIVLIHLCRSGLQPSLCDSVRRFLELPTSAAESLWRDLTGLRDDDWNRMMRTNLSLHDITITPSTLLALSRDTALLRVDGPIYDAVREAYGATKKKPYAKRFQTDGTNGKEICVRVENKRQGRVTVSVDDKRYLHIGEGVLLPEGRYRWGAGGRPWCSYAGNYKWPQKRA